MPHIMVEWKPAAWPKGRNPQLPVKGCLALLTGGGPQGCSLGGGGMGEKQINSLRWQQGGEWWERKAHLCSSWCFPHPSLPFYSQPLWHSTQPRSQSRAGVHHQLWSSKDRKSTGRSRKMSGDEAGSTADLWVPLWVFQPWSLWRFLPSRCGLNPDHTAVIKVSSDQGLPILTWIILNSICKSFPHINASPCQT